MQIANLSTYKELSDVTAMTTADGQTTGNFSVTAAAKPQKPTMQNFLSRNNKAQF